MQQYSSNAFGFEDLQVFQMARQFRNRIYELVRRLPIEEKFALGSQMRRAAVSLTNNLAEGYGRYSWQDITRFCHQARGSLFELVDDLGVCQDQGYATHEALAPARQEAKDVLMLINGYVRYLQKNRRAGDSTGAERGD